MAAKIRKGDTVIVIAGRDKGRTGEVIEMRREDGRRWCAASTSSSVTRNRAQPKRAASSPRNRRSTCRTLRWPIPRTAKPTRIGFKITGHGDARKKVRFAKRSGAEIDG